MHSAIRFYHFLFLLLQGSGLVAWAAKMSVRLEPIHNAVRSCGQDARTWGEMADFEGAKRHLEMYSQFLPRVERGTSGFAILHSTTELQKPVVSVTYK